MSKPLLLSFDGSIARVTLNRPERRNALSAQMWRDLPELVAQATETTGTKVIVLTGAGGHFAAGADISAFAETYATPQSAAAYGALVAAGVDSVAQCPKPVIAAIEGACVGGGCSLALACDFRIASGSARFGITPGKLGLAYGLADTRRLATAIGVSQAKLMLYTGRLIPADQALAIGLVDQLVEAAALAGVVDDLAMEIAAASQVSVRITKATLRLIEAGACEDTEQTRAWYLNAAASADFAEGRAAFMEKRKPVFPCE